MKCLTFKANHKRSKVKIDSHLFKNSQYDTYVKTGLPNREIWKRYIYPKYGISERTFYNLLKASGSPRIEDSSKLSAEGFLFPELFVEDETRDPSYFRKNP